jgi:hypothetical protein
VPEPLFVVPAQGRESDERYTPKWVFDGLGLSFDLDPASPIGGGDFTPATRRFTRHDDGLALEWFGLVWLNPPFSEATAWADRFRLHGCGVFLGPIANSRWWVDLARDADLLWLCRDITFVHPEHGGRHSSMPLAFAAMGVEATSALRRLALSGRHDGVLAVPDPSVLIPDNQGCVKGLNPLIVCACPACDASSAAGES